jgi:hypothetical protein
MTQVTAANVQVDKSSPNTNELPGKEHGHRPETSIEGHFCTLWSEEVTDPNQLQKSQVKAKNVPLGGSDRNAFPPSLAAEVPPLLQSTVNRPAPEEQLPHLGPYSGVDPAPLDLLVERQQSVRIQTRIHAWKFLHTLYCPTA